MNPYPIFLNDDNDRSSAFLLPEAEPSDLNTSRSDVLVSDNTDDLINTNEANSEPSTFDDPNDPYLNQQIFDEAELASNDYCHPSTPPASRKAKPRKRAVDENQCSTSVDPASPPASPPAVELPTLETIKDLLLIQDPLQKKWCSKSVIPGFSNIPVCKTMEAYYRGSWLNGDAPPSLVLQGLTSSLYDIVGKLRKHIYFIPTQTFPPPPRHQLTDETCRTYL